MPRKRSLVDYVWRPRPLTRAENSADTFFRVWLNLIFLNLLLVLVGGPLFVLALYLLLAIRHGF